MPAGSTWSRSRSACCVVSAWTVESTTQIGSAAKSKHGNDNEMPPALASNGCSQPTKRAPKWAAPILSWPKSHNHGAEVLGGPRFREQGRGADCTGSGLDRGLYVVGATAWLCR